MDKIRELNHEVYLLGITSGPKMDYTEINGVKVYRIPVNFKTWSKWKFAQYDLRALRPAIELKADVYHAQDLYSLPVAAVAATLNLSKLIYESRELFTETASLIGRDLEKKVWASQERWLIRRCDRVLTVCDSIAGVLSARYMIPKPLVIRSLPHFEVVERSDLLREHLGIDPERLIMLYQGNLMEGRGLPELIDAISDIESVDLVIIGQGPLKRYLEQYVRDAGLKETIHFMDFIPRDKLLAFTVCADLGVHLIQNTCLNHYYSLPNKLFEYIMAGIPVVVSNFPEIRRIVSEYDVGITVDPSNRYEIKEALKRLLGDHQLRETFAQKARKAAQELNWEKEAEKLKQVYSEIFESDNLG